MEMNGVPRKKSIWKKIILLLCICVLGYFGYRYFAQEEEVEYKTEQVEKRDIEQIVSVTGKVSSETRVDIDFQTVGIVEKIYKEVGQRVEEGDLIAELENQAQTIALETAEAELLAAEANLEQRIAGSTFQEIALAETRVDQAEDDLALAEVEKNSTVSLYTENLATADLAINRAEIALRTANINLEKFQTSSQKDIANAQKDVETARVNKQQAEVELKNNLQTSTNSVSNLNENLYNSIENTLVTLNKNIIEADNILGIDNRSANDTFQDLLGAFDGSLEPLALTQYYKTLQSYRNAKFIFENETSEFSTADLENAYTAMNTSLRDTKRLMDLVSQILDKTVTNTFFTQSDLNALKTQINSLQNTLLTSEDIVVQRYQALNNSFLSTNTADSQAQSNFEVVENNFIKAEQNLSKIINDVEKQRETLQSEIDSAQNSLSQANQDRETLQTEYNNALARAESQIALRKSALSNAKANLNVVKAPPREVDLKAFRAQIKQAKARVANQEFELSKTRIYAPAAGVISELDLEIGETNSGVSQLDSGQPTAVSIIADRLKVDADIPETDITKVKINDKVHMTLDAFPAQTVFEGTISRIDPAETLISGVVYYNIETLFEIEYEGVKPGMTANLDIVTEKRDNTLSVPFRAIDFVDNVSYVDVLVENQKVRQKIELGIEGETFIEVVSGLKEGDEIIIN